MVFVTMVSVTMESVTMESVTMESELGGVFVVVEVRI